MNPKEHGKILIGTSGFIYPQEELIRLAEKIRKLSNDRKDTFIYFNNDAKGYAVKNAQGLIQLLNR